MRIFSREIGKDRYFVRKAFKRFFWPAMLSSFWLAVAAVADSIYVGNGIGAAGLSAIGFGQPVYMFYNILSYGFSIGGSIHFASRLAEGHEEEGNRIFLSILKLLLVLYAVTVSLGLFFLPQIVQLLGAAPGDETTLTYIRLQFIFIPLMFLQGPFYYFVHADNAPRTAAAAMSLGGIADVCFGYIFIMRMHLGVAGSVYATVCGAILMLSITGWHILTHRGTLHLCPMKMDWKCIPISAQTGFATSIQYLFQFVTLIAVNRLLMSMGGTFAVAAFDVVYSVSELCVAIPEAAVIATEPMISTYRSERNTGNILTTLDLSLIWAAIFSLPVLLVMCIRPWALSLLFGMISGAERQYTMRGIFVYATSIIPMVVNVVFCGYYQAVLQEWLSYLITFLRSFLFFLSSLVICSFGGMDTVWFVFLAAEVLTILCWVPAAIFRGGFLQLKDINTGQAKSVVIDSSSRDISEVTQILQNFCREKGSTPKQVMYVGLTVEEICCVVAERFKSMLGEIYVQATVVVDEGETTLYLRDNVYAYNSLGENTENIRLDEGEGLDLVGVRIVQKNAKQFYYRRYSGFNTLVIRL